MCPLEYIVALKLRHLMGPSISVSNISFPLFRVTIFIYLINKFVL